LNFTCVAYGRNKENFCVLEQREGDCSAAYRLQALAEEFGEANSFSKVI
jgi:hypothetical protein